VKARPPRERGGLGENLDHWSSTEMAARKFSQDFTSTKISPFLGMGYFLQLAFHECTSILCPLHQSYSLLLAKTVE